MKINKFSFRVINGGRKAEDPSGLTRELYKTKALSLRQIRLALNARERGSLPPRAANSLVLGVLACFGAITVQLLFPVHTLVSLLVSTGIGVVVYHYIYRRSTAPATHWEHIDRLLTAYEPVSVDAYRELQGQIDANGAENHFVWRWLGAEYRAIETAAGWKLPSKSKFLKKRV